MRKMQNETDLSRQRIKIIVIPSYRDMYTYEGVTFRVPPKLINDNVEGVETYFSISIDARISQNILRKLMQPG